MNFKPSLARCAVMSLGLTLVGCGAAPETASEPASPATQQTSAEKPALTNATLVKLELPGMTWGGCAASVRSDLEKIAEINIIDLDTKSASGKFEIAEGFDFESLLAKLAETNSKIKGWSIAE